MKDSAVKMLLVSPSNGKDWCIVQIADLRDVAKALICRTFCWHIVEIGGYKLSAYYDGEKLLNGNIYKPILFDTQKHPLVCGRVLLGMLDLQGNDISLSERALNAVIDNIVVVTKRDRTDQYYAIGGVEW